MKTTVVNEKQDNWQWIELVVFVSPVELGDNKSARCSLEFNRFSHLTQRASSQEFGRSRKGTLTLESRGRGLHPNPLAVVATRSRVVVPSETRTLGWTQRGDADYDASHDNHHQHPNYNQAHNRNARLLH